MVDAHKGGFMVDALIYWIIPNWWIISRKIAEGSMTFFLISNEILLATRETTSFTGSPTEQFPTTQ
jgi:hypothetical protein